MMTKTFKTIGDPIPVVAPTQFTRTLWCNKANRDAAFVALGGSKAGYKKTSSRNQIINPKYVADSGVTGPTAFGDDTEMFGCLYSIVKVQG